MAEERLGCSLGDYWTDDGCVEAVSVDGFSKPILLTEAEAMGVRVERIAYLDSVDASTGTEYVRYLSGVRTRRASAEAKGFTIRQKTAAIRETFERQDKLDREHAASCDKAFKEREDAKMRAWREKSPIQAARLDAQIEEMRARVKIQPSEPDRTESAPSSPEPAQHLSSYEAEVLSTDAARLRPQATKLLLSIHNEDTLPVYQAEALLSAIPAEVSEPIEAPTMSYSHEDAAANTLIARVTEIRSLGLSQRAARGDADARAEARKLNAALQDYRSTGTDIVAALTAQGADMAPIADQARRAAR